jgi:hypothetical protein
VAAAMYHEQLTGRSSSGVVRNPRHDYGEYIRRRAVDAAEQDELRWSDDWSDQEAVAERMAACAQREPGMVKFRMRQEEIPCTAIPAAAPAGRSRTLQRQDSGERCELLLDRLPIHSRVLAGPVVSP